MSDQQFNSVFLCVCDCTSYKSCWFKDFASDCDDMYRIFCSLLIPVVEFLMFKSGKKKSVNKIKNKKIIKKCKYFRPLKVIFTANSIKCKIMDYQ